MTVIINNESMQIATAIHGNESCRGTWNKSLFHLTVLTPWLTYWLLLNISRHSAWRVSLVYCSWVWYCCCCCCWT